jgi:hypothetical protein
MLIARPPHAAVTLSTLLVLAAPAPSHTAEPEPVPEPPAIPENAPSGEPLEPEVTIIQRDSATLHEYRLNGRLYAVKVIPRRGPPYFLVDGDGDGVMETRRNELAPDFLIPSWVLFSW